MAELGASTMLPSLVAAVKYPEHLKTFSTDLPKIMPLIHQCHQLNGSPKNLIPIELSWGDKVSHARFKEQLDGRHVDLIVCSDLIYSEVSASAATR